MCAHRLDTRIGIGVGIGIGTRVGVEIGVGTLFVFNREENAGTVVIPRACGITCRRCSRARALPHYKWRADTFKRVAETGPRLANVVGKGQSSKIILKSPFRGLKFETFLPCDRRWENR